LDPSHSTKNVTRKFSAAVYLGSYIQRDNSSKMRKYSNMMVKFTRVGTSERGEDKRKGRRRENVVEILCTHV
jgi:hypothetical protein